MNNLNVLKSFFVNFLFAVCIVLPSGVLFGVNVKVAFVLITFSILLITGSNDDVRNFIIGTTVVLLYLILYAIYSLLVNVNNEFVFSHMKDLFTFSLFVFGSVYLLKPEIDTFKVIVYSACFISITKIIITVYSNMSGLPVSIIVKYIELFFNVKIMTIDVVGSVFSRISFTADVILAPILLVLTKNIMVNPKAKTVLVYFLLVLSVFISMSRFYWFYFLVCFLIVYLSNGNVKMTISLIALLFLFTLAFVFFDDSFYLMIESRFSEHNNDYSDGIRSEQFNYIFTSILSNPMFGSGIGFYLKDYIRSESLSYSYEIQLLAFVMQFGIVGFILYFSFVFYYLVVKNKERQSQHKRIVIFLLMMWIASGFLNPVMFSSIGGITFLIIYNIPTWFNKIELI